MCVYIVQSADMHVSAFHASSVQLGTHPHMWLHRIYTRELALTKRTYKRILYKSFRSPSFCLLHEN